MTTAALRKLSTVLCLFISMYSHAQNKDYIVTTDNDTLYGRITSMGAEVKIKGEDGKKTTVSNVQSVYANWLGERKILYPVLMPNGTQYMERLESGKISLYEQSEIIPKGGYAYMWYAQKDSGELKLVSVRNVMFSNKKKQRESLSIMLSDQKALADQFLAEEKNDIELVRRYIRSYNKGTGTIINLP